MPGEKQKQQHEQWLLELTGRPTAAGHEDRVIQWVRQWVDRRSTLTLRADDVGNLIIEQSRAGNHDARPVFITAHLDHPAFVVRTIHNDRHVECEFRGGVHDPYFDEARVDLFDASDDVHTGRITSLNTTTKPFKRVEVALSRKADTLKPGDVGRWAFRGRGRGAEPEIHDGLLYAPACDDLAGVAAALAALDVLRRRKNMQHVGVLLTRAEEVGFLGAIAAARDKSLPGEARLICLENSRSFAESPIGGGPIVRVGDKMSVFDPRLTNRLTQLLEAHNKKHKDFKWQRKLMPGGTCEATVFSTFGYESTCLCLPLGNYHNMRDIDNVAAGKRPARVAPEFISIADYHGLIEMLEVCIGNLDDANVPAIDERLQNLLTEREFVLAARHNWSSTA